MGRTKYKAQEELLNYPIILRVNEIVFKRLEKLVAESSCQSVGEVARKILSREKILCFYKDITMNAPMEELNYNENKVKAGSAELIMASRFAGEVSQLGFNQKLNRFGHLTDLNSHVKPNSLHIMLNFDVKEQPGHFKLQQIAAAYMEKIGFGDQPYLVYKHEDAAHPHIHIVTTNIKEDGTRINLHDIGKRLSEPARKEIEKEFGLIKAEGKGLKDALTIKPVNIEKAEYGKTLPSVLLLMSLPLLPETINTHPLPN